MNFIQFVRLYNIKSYEKFKKVCDETGIKLKEKDNRVILLTNQEKYTKLNKTIIDKRNLKIISYCGPTHKTYNIQTAEIVEKEILETNFNKFTITDSYYGTHLKFYYYNGKWWMALYRQIDSSKLEINGVNIYKLFLDKLSDEFKDYKFKKSYTYCFVLLDIRLIKMRMFESYNGLKLTNIYTSTKRINSKSIEYLNYEDFYTFSERCKQDDGKIGFVLEYNNLKFNIFSTHFDKINSLMSRCKDIIEGYFRARTKTEDLNILLDCYECGDECIIIERIFRKFGRLIHTLYMERFVKGNKIDFHNHRYIGLIKSIHKLRPKDCKIRYKDVLRILGSSLSDNNKKLMKDFRRYYRKENIKLN